MVQHVVTVLGLLISLVAHLQVDLKQGVKYFYASAAVWAFSLLVRVILTALSAVGIGRFRGLAVISTLPDEVTRLDIETTGKHTWQPGQHVYIRLTRLNPFVSAHVQREGVRLISAIASVHYRVCTGHQRDKPHDLASCQDT